MQIEFLYFASCPSHEQARALLCEVLAEAGLNVPIVQIAVETDTAVQHYAFCGSPTIRINGVDIVPLPEGTLPALACRAYRCANGRLAGVPPREAIVAALAQVH